MLLAVGAGASRYIGPITAIIPRLCRLLAVDDFLPLGFAHLGRRLVYSLGIVVLAVIAGVLLVAFGGITDALIPLYAVGALLAFTMSQWGMVAHCLSFAVTISPDVEAVMVETGDERAGAGHVESLRGCWQPLIDDPVSGCGHRPIPLVTLPFAYREFYLPFLRYVRETAVRHPDRYIAVVVPEVLKRRWYDFILSGHRSSFLRTQLRLHGGPRVLIVDAPWRLHER